MDLDTSYVFHHISIRIASRRRYRIEIINQGSRDEEGLAIDAERPRQTRASFSGTRSRIMCRDLPTRY